jgi:hypothetical protein
MSYPWKQDHVLVVSRTYLPVNVAPRRLGGAAIYPGSMTDESIAAWVGRQLTGPGAVRKSPVLRRMRGALIGGTGNPENSSRLWEDTEVFISYRSADAAAARRLAAELSAGRHHGGRPMRTVLLEPGQLAHPEEVLSPLLRWNTLAVISDIVMACREIWVVANPDYLASWWTQGELICRLYAGSKALLQVCSPGNGRIPTVPEGLTATLSDVLSEDFWNVPLLQCPRCSLAGRVPDRLDIGSFLLNTSPRLYPVPPASLEEHARDGGELHCPNGCGMLFTISPLPPRYLWYALPAGPHSSFLESLPAYKATSVQATR